MAGTTNALAVKAALRDMLTGLPSLAGVQTTWGFPGREPEPKWSYVGKVDWDTSEWATNRSRQERFVIDVTFSVQLFAATAEDAERAVMALAADAEAALKDNPTLGIAAVVSSDFIPRRLGSWPIDDGFEAQLEINAAFTARL